MHLAHEEHPDADQQQHREPGDQDLEQRVHVALDRPCDDAHTLLGQPRDQPRVGGREGGEAAPVGQAAGDVRPLNGNVAHLARLDLVQEVAVRHLHLSPAGGAARGLKQVEQCHQQQCHDDPQGNISAEIAHSFWFPIAGDSASLSSNIGDIRAG